MSGYLFGLVYNRKVNEYSQKYWSRIYSEISMRSKMDICFKTFVSVVGNSEV